MYAVIESGGKQHRVELGSEIQVDRLEAQPGDSITLERVLLVADDDNAAIGQPVVDGASVSAEVLAQARGEKIVVFKYKPKARTRVKQGFRAELTTLRITDIAFGGKSAAKEAEKAQKAEAKKAKEAEKEEKAEAKKAADQQAAADAALAAKLAESESEAKPKTAKKASAKKAADTAEPEPEAEASADVEPEAVADAESAPAAEATADADPEPEPEVADDAEPTPEAESEGEATAEDTQKDG